MSSFEYFTTRAAASVGGACRHGGRADETKEGEATEKRLYPVMRWHCFSPEMDLFS